MEKKVKLKETEDDPKVKNLEDELEYRIEVLHA